MLYFSFLVACDPCVSAALAEAAQRRRSPRAAAHGCVVCGACPDTAMDRFHAIEAFVKVVETGSFARAAERLGVSVSSVSRHVAELEAHLDARLLNRTTRRLSLTESGRAFHERCVQLLADL